MWKRVSNNWWILVVIAVLVFIMFYSNLYSQFLNGYSSISPVVGLKVTVGPIALSPDGTKLTTITNEGIKVWKLPEKELIATFGTDIAELRNSRNHYLIAWSPDGDLIVTSGANLTVNVWQVSSRKLVQTLKHFSTGNLVIIKGLTFSPDGKFLYVSVYEGGTKVWQRKGEKFEVYSDFSEYNPIFSPVGNLVVLPITSMVKKLDNEKLTTIRDLGIAYEPVKAIQFSPDGKLLAIGTYTELCIWTTTDWKKINLGDATQRTPLGYLAFSPDARYLAVAEAVNFWGSGGEYDTHDIWIWRVSDGQIVKKLSGQGRDAQNIIWHPDGKSILASGGDNIIRIWPVDDLK